MAEKDPIKRGVDYRGHVEYERRYKFAQTFVRKYYGERHVMGSLVEEAVRAKRLFFDFKKNHRAEVDPEEVDVFDTTSLYFMTNFATIEQILAKREKEKWPEDTEERHKLLKQEGTWYALRTIFRNAIDVNLDEMTEE